jgi:hypothetical protein
MVPDLGAMYPAAFEGYQFDWHSFPSDQRALYFAIDLGTLGRQCLLGMALLIWSLAGVAFPRLYVGYHYPLDILGEWRLQQRHWPRCGGRVDGSVASCSKSIICRPVIRQLPRQACFVCASRSRPREVRS